MAGRRKPVLSSVRPIGLQLLMVPRIEGASLLYERPGGAAPGKKSLKRGELESFNL